MSYTKGQKVTLSSAALYESSTSKSRSSTISGTYYIWNAGTKNSRVRICEKKSYAGKSPASKYCTGWVNTAKISSKTTSGSEDTSSGTTSSGRYKKGQKIHLSGAAVYETSTAKTRTATVYDDYYIYSTTIKNGRIRICGKKSYAGKSPASKHCTGWVNVSKISTTKEENKDITTEEPSDVELSRWGYIGDVPFEVSNSLIRTLESFKWSGSANYGVHDRIGHRSIVEFTGASPESISFSIPLGTAMGSTPTEDFEKLRDYRDSGTPVLLAIGAKRYGYDSWVISEATFSGGKTRPDGDWVTATVSLSLTAYE